MLETTPFSRISHPLVPGVKYDLWHRCKGNKDSGWGLVSEGQRGEIGGSEEGKEDRSSLLPFPASPFVC